MDDIRLILKIKDGDQDAFCTLVKKYQTQVLRTAYLISNNRYTSEEIVQETFVQCYLHIGKLKNPNQFKSWFYKILIRTAWKQIKKDNCAIPTESIIEKADFESINDTLNCYIQNEFAEAVYAEIQQLEIKQKTVILLYYYSGLNVKEIAKIMDCFEGTVKSRLFTARKNLKQNLKDLQFENVKEGKYFDEKLNSI